VKKGNWGDGKSTRPIEVVGNAIEGPAKIHYCALLVAGETRNGEKPPGQNTNDIIRQRGGRKKRGNVKRKRRLRGRLDFELI